MTCINFIKWEKKQYYPQFSDHYFAGLIKTLDKLGSKNYSTLTIEQ